MSRIRYIAVLVLLLVQACSPADTLDDSTRSEVAESTTIVTDAPAPPASFDAIEEEWVAWSSSPIADYDLEYTLITGGADTRESVSYQSVVRGGEVLSCYVNGELSRQIPCDPRHFTVETIFSRVDADSLLVWQVSFDERWHIPRSLSYGGTTTTAEDSYSLDVLVFEPAEPIDWLSYVSDTVEFVEQHYPESAQVDWESLLIAAQSRVLVDGRQANAHLGLRNALDPLRGVQFQSQLGVVVRQADADAVVEQLVVEPPTGERLASGIGLLTLSGVDPGRFGSYAANVHDLMREIDVDQVCGWVVDLRDHRIQEPARDLLALGPLLGDGPLIRFDSPYGETVWTYDSGTILADGDPITDVYASLGVSTAGLVLDTPYETPIETPPVVVLTSIDGLSDLLIAFLGRPATYLVGAPVWGDSLNLGPDPAGLVESMELPDGATVSVLVGSVSDRLGRPPDVTPDERVLADPRTDEDEVFDTAQAWLAEQPGCIS